MTGTNNIVALRNHFRAAACQRQIKTIEAHPAAAAFATDKNQKE